MLKIISVFLLSSTFLEKKADYWDTVYITTDKSLKRLCVCVRACVCTVLRLMTWVAADSRVPCPQLPWIMSLWCDWLNGCHCLLSSGVVTASVLSSGGTQSRVFLTPKPSPHVIFLFVPLLVVFLALLFLFQHSGIKSGLRPLLHFVSCIHALSLDILHILLIHCLVVSIKFI